MQMRPAPAGSMPGYSGELFASYNAVEARREWEIGMIRERLGRNEVVDTAVCRVERVGGGDTVRFGLKRGKLLYLFKYRDHNVEREKHRNVITRARFIKDALEAAGYRTIPWDFKKGQPPTFWQDHLAQQPQPHAMEEEDDDLYGPSETTAAADTKNEANDSDGDQGDEPMDEGDESADDDGDDDDDESDSDIEIILDKPQAAPKPATQQTPQESKAIKIEPPPQTSTPSQRPPAATPIPAGTAPTLPSQPGTAFPAIKSSTIDVNADPIYPPVGKPVSQIDIDADLAESTKPWRLPGADQSDYFNYGFDEFTWEMYRQRQSNMANTLATQKAETAQFQQMFGMGGGPPQGGGGAPAQPAAGGVPGAPTGPAGGAPGGAAGMPPMPGMNEEQMQMMMAQMQGSGMDLANMDFNTFMQMAGGMGGGFPGQPQAGFGGQQGNQGGGGRGGGRRGRGGW